MRANNSHLLSLILTLTFVAQVKAAAPADLHAGNEGGLGPCGYHDENNVFLILPRWKKCAEFDGGEFAAVQGSNGKWGFIDSAGAVIVPPRYEFARQWGRGGAPYGLVTLDGKEGCVDRAGKMAVAPAFPGLNNCVISEGKVIGADRPEPQMDGPFRSTETRWGYASVDGRIIAPPTYTDAEPFSHGRAAVKSGDAYGFIDETGHLVIPPNYDEVVSPFGADGRAQVAVAGMVSWIDANGRTVSASSITTQSPAFRLRPGESAGGYALSRDLVLTSADFPGVSLKIYLDDYNGTALKVAPPHNGVTIVRVCSEDNVRCNPSWYVVDFHYKNVRHFEADAVGGGMMRDWFRWTPDGRAVLFYSAPDGIGGDYRILIGDPDSATMTPIVLNMGDDLYGPDGSFTMMRWESDSVLIASGSREFHRQPSRLLLLVDPSVNNEGCRIRVDLKARTGGCVPSL